MKLFPKTNRTCQLPAHPGTTAEEAVESFVLALNISHGACPPQALQVPIKNHILRPPQFYKVFNLKLLVIHA